MAGEKILIIEDDATMLRGLKDNFEYQDYRVYTATNGQDGYESALLEKPDLILLDLMLPKINGYEVCRLLRKEGLETPIIMLTAKSEETDVVLGLNIGADDYVTKPFSIKELLARSNALMRRKRSIIGKSSSFGDFTINFESRKLTRAGKEISLTPREFSLLEYLAHRPGRALTRDEILRAVWGWQIIVTARSVDRCITTLRHKLESGSPQANYIKTVRGLGYRFEPPEPDEASA